MPPAVQYRFIQATPVQMDAAFPPLVEEGWKPILMSSAMSDNGQLKVFIVLEKPVGSWLKTLTSSECAPVRFFCISTRRFESGRSCGGLDGDAIDMPGRGAYGSRQIHIAAELRVGERQLALRKLMTPGMLLGISIFASGNLAAQEQPGYIIQISDLKEHSG
jgi:hypothetical protein